MAAGLTASRTVHPAPWFCQKKGQLSGTRQIVLAGHWGGVKMRAGLPRATPDGEESNLRVQVARARSSSRSGQASDAVMCGALDRFTHARLVSVKCGLRSAARSEI